MKKLDKFVLRSFIGPFALIFLITLFLLDMQFLWKYIDDLVGKGLEWYVIVQLMFFASASFVPLALPLAMLLSSLMTMGSMGEFYELTAIKAAGISLNRIMRSMFAFALLLALFAFLFANYVLPVSLLKFESLLQDIRNQKPVFAITEGVFYNGLDNYSMRVSRKGRDGKTLYDVMIFDHSSGRGVDNVLKAESGDMSITADKKYMILNMYNGTRYQDMNNDQGNVDHEQMRMNFSSWHKVFDMSGFKLSRTNEAMYKHEYQLLNLVQLNHAIDTFYIQKHIKQKLLNTYTKPYSFFLRTNLDSVLQAKHIAASAKIAYDTMSPEHKKIALRQVESSLRNIKSFTNMIMHDDEVLDDNIMHHKLEWWRKISLSFTCVVLFLIGAPLGAIVRKGGLGLPFVIAIILFLVLYIILISSEKLAIDYILSPFWGMWLANALLIPVGIYIIYKAGNDSNLFNMERYVELWTRLMSYIKRHTDEI